MNVPGRGDSGERGASGARGESGDRGVTGERGQSGDRGESGDRGIAGERGPKGDHGQHGEKGEIGTTGVAGPIGRTGPTSPYLGRTQTLVIFAFIVLGFVLLAFRTEATADRAQQGVYQACLARAEISRLTGTLPGPNCGPLR